MNKRDVLWGIFLFFSGFFPSDIYAQVRVVLSAALSSAQFEFRRQQYIDMFATLKTYGLGPDDIYVVEALKKKGPTFLDEYCSNVFYAQTNRSDLQNKGLNEAITMLEGLRHFDFDPDDMILKVTGRYNFESTVLFELIAKNPDVDALVKHNQAGEFLNLGFVMRNKYLQKIYEHVVGNLAYLENEGISLERATADVLSELREAEGARVMEVATLGIWGNLRGSSTTPGIPEDVRHW